MPELSSTETTLVRMAAFAEQPGGGNPAGVWMGPTLPSAAEMQRLAEEVGYSETAFLSQLDGNRWRIRYFSPQMEVPFCGHATIATGVVLGRRYGAGTYTLETRVGDVPVEIGRAADGQTQATLTSVEPSSREASAALVDAALACLGWSRSHLDPSIPPRIAFAGASHLVLAVGERSTLAAMDYDFEPLKELMTAHDLITLQLIWRQDASTFRARNPFPVGGVVEDPATGAAAAALGGYLRELGALRGSNRFLICQGDDMGRPSRLHVEVPDRGGVRVTGKGLAIE